MAHKANLSWITDDLATGGDLSYVQEVSVAQALDIEAQGITQIIDMRQEDNDHAVWENFPGIRYMWLPTDDRYGHSIPEDLFDTAVQADRIAREHGRKVFVHCHMGINRGPSVAYALLLDRGYGITEAWDMIRAARPIAMMYYAKDALKAHHSRRIREGNLGFDRGAERYELQEHIRTHLTDEDRGAIQHVMAELHKRDAAEWEHNMRELRRSNFTH